MSASIARVLLITALIGGGAAAAAAGPAAGYDLSPTAGATDINPDTHLVLTFRDAPSLGTSGLIRIIDTDTNRVVDTLDMGTPAGPAERGPLPGPPPGVSADAATAARGLQGPVAEPPAIGRVTNATAVAGTTPGHPHPSREYQLTIIGGVQQGFHFHPVIIHGNVATIYPHNNLLDYRKTYRVEIDPGVLTVADGSFTGIGRDANWTFSTKPSPPPATATRLVVAADGTGDFCTVQGALDFVPDHPAERVTIFIRNGSYEEIVFFHDKSNLTLRGEDREQVQIGYGNNSRFNSPYQADAEGHLLLGPSRRCAFAIYHSTGIVLTNFTVSNTARGQAEALMIVGSRNLVSEVTINGSGDALDLRGPVYFAHCRIQGDGDTILNAGPAFFHRCELSSRGPYLWVRNPATNHGDVFVECAFDTPPGVQPPSGRAAGSVIARHPDNHGVNYPYAEAVLINCRLRGIAPEGWGPIDGDTENLHFWEYASTNLSDGAPVDVSRRHPASKQLTMEKDAAVIAAYSDPAFVLDGWKPELQR